MMQHNKDLIAECLAHKKHVYNFVFRMTSDEMLSEEIVQETYLKVFKNLHRFKGNSELKTWIIAIAKNEVFKAFKIRQKSIKDLEKLRRAENEKFISTEEHPHENAEYIEQVKNGCLYALLQCLPFQQRCAFILHVLNEISIKSISHILAKSENACRILIFRAKARIKEFLCDHCEHITDNPQCRCQNMVNFSLQHHLIKKIDKDTQVDAAKLELRKFKDEIELYKSLPEKELANINLCDSDYKILFKK